jgi:hypothetical protein
MTNDPTDGAPGRLEHGFLAVVVALVHRIVRGARHTIACQEHLHERYLEGLGTSGLDARALLVSRSQEERDLEALFNAAAISPRHRQPARPVRDD